MELARPAMAAAPARERGERERERAGSGEGDGEGMLVPLLIGSRAQGVHDAWSSSGEHGIRVSPMGPTIEHLARAMEPEFRHVFQHIPGSFGSVGLYQSCCPPNGLPNSLRVPSH